jgi:hypothetical protein
MRLCCKKAVDRSRIVGGGAGQQAGHWCQEYGTVQGRRGPLRLC